MFSRFLRFRSFVHSGLKSFRNTIMIPNLEQWRRVRASSADDRAKRRRNLGSLGLALAVTLVSNLALWSTSAMADGETPALHQVRTFERRHLTDVFFCEGATFGDVSGDGVSDIVSGPYWYRGPEFRERRAYYPAKPFDINGYSDNFFAWVHDVSKDGRNDIVIVGFPGQAGYWYENPGDTMDPWPRHPIIDEVSNESPEFRDIDGDGTPEFVCIQKGRYGYVRMDPAAPRDPWTFVAISPDLGLGRFTHGMGVGDVNSDGRIDVLEKTGWYEQPVSLGGAPLWKHHEFTFAQAGGAQMYAYDVDGDGDSDVITSLEAHGYGIVWYEHIARDGAIDFAAHTIVGRNVEDSPYGVRFTQPHAIDLVDMDGDGLKDIVTGKRFWAHQGNDPGEREKAVLYWFRLTRNAGTVDWVPYLIDDDSGVGTQVVAGDIDGDGAPDVVVGNKKGTFVHLQRARSVSEAEWRSMQPRRTVSTGQSPADAARSMTVPPGFSVRLAAGEPDVHQPVAFTIDERGRLWVVEGHSYPQRRPEGEGLDNIVILEDGDGDGGFETRKVFASGLNLVSGIEVGFGGVFVGAAPYLLFLADRDRDDRPDGDPEVLLDGWGYQDTHETLNSFQWGPDGWLYGCHGVFTHSLVGKPGARAEARVPINAGVWRFHPRRQEFEVFAHGTSNPWGVDFNDVGEAFITACVIPHLFHVIPGARYIRQAGRHFSEHTYVEIDTIATTLHHGGGRWTPEHFALSDGLGGGHAHCGAMIYLGDNFPPEYRGSVFMNNIHGNRVNVDALEPRGSGWAGVCRPDFLFANDKWYRGISLRSGPDGSVFASDWYDRNACHLTDPVVWDRTNGRIYNVVYGDPGVVRVDLSSKSNRELVALQTHANDWFVRQARRILQERGPDPATHSLLSAAFRAASDERRKLRFLWALHVTEGLDETTALEATQSEHTHVRAWAVRLLAQSREVSPRTADRLAELSASDSSPVVRLALAAALQRLPSRVAWRMAESLSLREEDSTDHNVPALLWYGIEPLVAGDLERGLALAARARIPLIQRLAVRRAAAEVRKLSPVISAIVRVPDSAFRTLVLEEMVRAFESHAKLDMPPEWIPAYEVLQESSDPRVGELSQVISVKFGDRRIFGTLRGVASDSGADRDQRRHALRVLLDGEDVEVVPVLQALLGEPEFRPLALRGLARFDDPGTPAAILAAYGALSPVERIDALNTLASRPSYGRALLTAIGRGEIPRRDVSAFTVRQLRSFADAEIDRSVAEVWGRVRESDAEKKEIIESWRGVLTPDFVASGDVTKGRVLFASTCATCHRLFQSGGTIAPDLTGSNRRDLAYVLENIFDSNAVVGKDYQLQIFVLRDGRVVSGLVVRESETAFTVRTVNEEILVAKSEIRESQASDDSLMPDGLLENFSREDVRDLIAYLSRDAQVPLPGAAVRIDPTTHRVAGSIEGEKLRVVSHRGGTLGPQGMTGFGRDLWSDNAQLFWNSPSPGDEIVLALPVDADGVYAVDVALTKAIDYGIVQFSLDGKDIESPIDLFNDGVIPSGTIRLGEFELAKGEHRLGVMVAGIRPEAVRKYMFGLDYVLLTAR
jgi:putative membrane-bound dehydrogenase-like protein